MSTAQQIGSIASSTDKLIVQRQGEQLALKQGDAILAGDVMQNTDSIAVDIELKAQTAGQADSLVTLAPNSAAQIGTIAIGEGGDAAGTMIEVTSLTDGVELYAVGEGANGAVLASSAGSFSGLVGAGLLAGGGGLAGAGTVAAVVGGTAGVAAIASSDNNDATVTASTDTRVDNGDDTTPIEETPTEEEETTEEPTPEEPTPEEPAPEEPAADSPLAPLTDALADTPLAPVGDGLTMVTSALPLSSIPTSPDALPIPVPAP